MLANLSPARCGHRIRRSAALVLLGLCVSVSAASAEPDAADSLAAPASAPAEAPVSALGDSTAAPAPERAQMNPPLKVGSRRVRLTGASRNVVRSGPGDSFAVVGVYKSGTEFHVLAKSGDWIGVRVSETETGWVHRSLCKEMDDMAGLEFKPNPKLFSRTGMFLVEGYAGGYAFDQKSNSLALGGRLGYYVFDRVVVEGGVSWTHIDRPAEIVESLFGLSLEAEQFHMMYYHFMATYELLPGRQMVPYLSAGVGTSILRGESEPSVNFGAGTTLYLSRRAGVRWEVRDYRFTSGPADARHTNDNIELTIGSLYFF